MPRLRLALQLSSAVYINRLTSSSFVLRSTVGTKLWLCTVYVVFIACCIFLNPSVQVRNTGQWTGNVTSVQNWCARTMKVIHITCDICKELSPKQQFSFPFYFKPFFLFSKTFIDISFHIV